MPHGRSALPLLWGQLGTVVPADEIFGNEYAYFSSYSDTWVRHCRKFAKMAVARLGLDETSQVVEVGSNDGYLLQFMKELGIPSLGIEPARNVAAAAVERGIDTRVAFFDPELAATLVREGKRADLLIANNVLAHVPDLNGFVKALKMALAEGGTITIEVPHLLRLMENNQFDTIYHEHYSYFSLGTARRIFAHHGLTVYDVEELSTHGGSLRIYLRHSEEPVPSESRQVARVIREEEARGLATLACYENFSLRVERTRWELLEFLITRRREGASVVGYGAPGKASTLLNYCGVRTDLVDYTVDRSPHKQGTYLPGSRIPVSHPDRIRQSTPDYVLILPWNLTGEIVEQMSDVRSWGGRFVVAIPEVRVLD